MFGYFGRKINQLSNAAYGYILTLPSLAFLVVMCAIPFLYVVLISFYKWDPFSPHRFIGLDNYIRILSDGEFHAAFFNTLKYTGGSITLAFFISLTTALTLNNIRKFPTLSRIIAVLPWTVPMVVAALVFKWLFTTDFGVINDVLFRTGIITRKISWLGSGNTAMLILILADAWIRLGFMIILFLAGLQGIPKEEMDAASIDGAGPLGRFRYIIIPHLKPAMLAALLIQTMFSFRAVAIVYSLTRAGPGGTTETFPIYIYRISFANLHFGYSAALSIVMTMCIGVIVIFYLWVFREES